ncbi:MAG TPA: winged helix-turn-helix domain-containing protein [Pyrinomonadaceae bacterium]|nr:winged helix-turn-helix domain-containing protein [Pyrinomonadaceae bacterium]
MENNSPRFFEFGDFKIDARRRVLTRENEQIAISAKNFDLLIFLIQNEGRILSHDELLDSVWEGTFVEQSNLKKGISAIRHLLGETPESSNYIKTIPRKGYCFVSPVRAFSEETLNQQVQITTTEVIVEEEIIEDNELHILTKPVHQLVEKNNAQNSRSLIPILITIPLLIIGGVAIWYFTRQTKPTQFSTLKLENLKPQKLSTNGDINEATLSNDGKFFVYALQENDNRQSLWLRRIGSMNAINLVPPTKVDFRSITVAADNDSVYYGVTVENYHDVLYQVPILGGTPRKVIDDISSSPCFSADGKKVGFLRDIPNTGRSLLIFNLETGKEEGIIYNVKGDNHGIIAPRLSPDGTKFVFITSERTADGRTWILNEIPSSGGQPRPIIPPRKGKIYDFRWLSDGSGLVMAADLNDNRQSQLWKVSLPNGEIQRLSNDLLDYMNVNLSDDGKSILTVQEERKADLWKSDFAKPAAAEQVTKNINLPNRFDVGPDDKIIAEVFENAIQTLTVINPVDYSSQQFLIQTSADRSPSFSADGQFVYYVSRISGSDQIWRAESNGRNPTKLTDGKTFVINPRLSPDGQIIYFEQYNDSQWQLVKMPKDGGEPVLITDDTVNNYDISPDGKLIAYHYLDQQTKKWKIRVRNVSDNSIYKDLEITSNSLIKFTPDSKSIIYNLSDAIRDGGNVWIQSLDGGASKPLIELKNEKIYWANFSNDGKSLFYTKGKTTASAVLLSLETPK